MHRRDFLKGALFGGTSATLISTLGPLAAPSEYSARCHHLYHMASGMMEMITYEGIA